MARAYQGLKAHKSAADAWTDALNYAGDEQVLDARRPATSGASRLLSARNTTTSGGNRPKRIFDS